MDYLVMAEEMKPDLNRIADALYQEHPNAWIVIRQYLERLIAYTEALEKQKENVPDFEEKYATWGNAMGMLLDAIEAEDRVLVADIITFEVLPLL